MKVKTILLTTLGLCLFASAGAQSRAAEAKPASALGAARLAQPEKAMLLAAANAEGRIVAVGERGVVLLSDDGGRSYRQARSVPTRATLTAVSFVDKSHGWAVGHRGSILATTDGGESWQLQREDRTVDQPLFSVWFKDAQHGLAAGLWSLLLSTTDGGRTWAPVALPAAGGGGKADRNLFQIFADRQDGLFITAERGAVLRSRDQGRTWQELATGSKGTFWTGCVLDSGVILVGGLQGKIYRSTDGGQTWAAVASGTRSSITAITPFPDGRVVAVGLDGVILESRDEGLTYRVDTRPDRVALTAVAAGPGGQSLYFSARGVVTDQPAH